MDFGFVFLFDDLGLLYFSDHQLMITGLLNVYQFHFNGGEAIAQNNIA